MIVITAASGQLGNLVVTETLKRVSPAEITVSVRDAEKAQDLAAQGITVKQADYDNVASMVAAFSGADKLVFISGNAPVEARNIQHQNVVTAAEQAGVKQVIYTSFLDADPASPFPFSASHVATENMLRQSALDWVLLRPSVYMDSLLGEAQGAIASGVLSSAVPQGRMSYITRADIARAIAAIVASDGHSKQVYTLTGPAAVSYSEIADLLATISGKPVAFQATSPRDYAAGLEQYGLPPFLIAALEGLQQAMDENRLAPVSDDVTTLTGQPAASVESYLARQLAG